MVDVIVRPEVPFDQLQARGVELDLFGRKIKIAAIEDLVTMKRAADRGEDPHV